MFTTNPILLKTLLAQVAARKIQLPDFQRGWVWDDERIKGLLVSISRGFPVGAIMTLQSGGDIRFKSRPVEGIADNGDVVPQQFLLDGQQRLTSLYQALVYDGAVDTEDSRRRRIKRWYYIDMLKALNPSIEREDAIISVPEDKRVTENFGRKIVLDLSSRELEFKNHMMPTERLLDSMSWILAYNSYWASNDSSHPTGNLPKFMQDFGQFLTDFNGYSLPVIDLQKGTPKEAVCKVFEKVNTGGVPLNVFELVTASFAADDFQLREDWAKRRDRMRSGFGVLHGIEGEHFLQAVTLLTTYERRKKERERGVPENQLPVVTCRKEAILNLDLADYKHWADAVEIGFEESAKFLNRQFVFRGADVPYSTQLIPMATLFVELDKELTPSNAKAKLERWYWSGIFSESYSGNETQYALDMQQVAAYIRNGDEPTLITQANFIPERLLTLRTRNSAAYKGLYALQMKSGASDWRSAEPLSLATLRSAPIDLHHIFPKRWCEKDAQPQIPRRLYNSIINKTPIDAETNRIIGGNSPSTYINRLVEKDIDPDKLDRILKSHWIDPDLLRSDDFANSFVERGARMLRLISLAIGKPISDDGRDAFRNALNSVGFEIQEDIDDIDDADAEYDLIGERAYEDAAD